MRTSSAVSHSAPMNQQCPPVTVSGRPAVTRRGPRAMPEAMASRTVTSRNERAPRSRAVVTPTLSRRRALRSISTSCSASVSAFIRATGSGPPSKPRWTWQSNIPGISVTSPRSCTIAAAADAGRSAARPTQVITVPSTTTAPSSITVGSTGSVAATTWAAT